MSQEYGNWKYLNHKYSTVCARGGNSKAELHAAQKKRVGEREREKQSSSHFFYSNMQKVGGTKEIASIIMTFINFACPAASLFSSLFLALSLFLCSFSVSHGAFV